MRLIGIQLYKKTLPAISKSLAPGWYPFLKCKKDIGTSKRKRPKIDEEVVCPKDFYRTDERLPEINVTAIVGKNGTGKSSLLDIMFCLINNLACRVIENVDLKKASSLQYAEGLYARLYFEIDDKVHYIESSDKKTVYFGKKSDGKIGLFDLSKVDSMDMVHEVFDNFFYTIIVNYSLYSLNEYDYPHVPKIDRNGRKTGTIRCGRWIPYLFHKNDGYLTPIVLTPFRKNGTIDIQSENNLAIRRLAILSILFKAKGQTLIEGYEPYFISYRNIVNYVETKRRELEEKLRFRELTKVLYLFYNHFEQAWKKILDDKWKEEGYDKRFDDVEFSQKELALSVLAIKSTKICLTYPDFFDKMGVQGLVDMAEEDPEWLQKKESMGPGGFLLSKEERKKCQTSHFYAWYGEDKLVFEKLVNLILSEDTHVTAKARNIYIYLHNAMKGLENGEGTDADSRWYGDTGAYGVDQLIKEYPCETYEEVELLMPPSFFAMDLLLKRTEGDQSSVVSMRSMSSGERQLLYSLSYVFYHMHNLQTIKKNDYRVPYHHINLVFDETELYYHPEFQRLYLNKLLNALSWCNYKTSAEKDNVGYIKSINILLITHSPFLLSDIPSCNVLFLGQKNPEGPERTFGANVNELLADSFFLSNGFMGEFAKDKICSLINYLESEGTNPNDKWNKDSALKLINMVGDDVIRMQLKNMYVTKFGMDSDSYKKWLRAECQRLGLNVK